MERSTNALAELADRFDTFIALIPCFVEPADEKMLDCIKRIITELAKVDGMERISFECLASMLSECRDIAEEGAENEKND